MRNALNTVETHKNKDGTQQDPMRDAIAAWLSSAKVLDTNQVVRDLERLHKKGTNLIKSLVDADLENKEQK